MLADFRSRMPEGINNTTLVMITQPVIRGIKQHRVIRNQYFYGYLATFQSNLIINLKYGSLLLHHFDLKAKITFSYREYGVRHMFARLHYFSRVLRQDRLH